MDVFGNLNNFLSNDETPTTFKYDSCNNTPNSSMINDEVQKSEEIIPLDDNIIDISINEPVKVSPKKRGRKRGAQTEVDLTTDPVMLSPSKSRRRIVDELKDAIIEAEIDLCNLGTPEPSVSQESTPSQKQGRPKRQKKPAAAKKPKKISYKKALAVTNTAIPELPPTSYSQISQTSSSISCLTEQTPSVSATRSFDDFSVDLTGEVSLKSYHTSAPLFQKNTCATRSQTKKQVDKKQSTNSQDMEIDIDAITLRIKINNKVEKFQHNPDHRFFELLKVISDRFNFQVSKLLLFDDKDKRIPPEETPNGIGHKISSIYTCRIMDESKNKVKKENLIELKFQSDKWKKPIVLKMSRLDSLSTWVKVLCEKNEVNFTPDQISLEFDGDHIDMNESPLELDFEGGEILDCRIKA